jgi:hypothetical protein
MDDAILPRELIVNEGSEEQPTYDVVVDRADGEHVTIESRLCKAEAERVRIELSTLFLGVRVVERPAICDPPVSGPHYPQSHLGTGAKCERLELPIPPSVNVTFDGLNRTRLLELEFQQAEFGARLASLEGVVFATGHQLAELQRMIRDNLQSK